ncbi:MAG: thiamine-phosphate kinase [Thermoplasmata archaeon]|nr:thiamine-phosphate kinase [Thermoplasmata archaeon]
MKLSEIGERKIVEKIIQKFSIPMDDCAVIDNGNEYMILTTDMMNEKTHFPQGSKPYYIGWYSIAVNLSDIAAKGGKPLAILAAISMPRSREINFFEEILNGMEDCVKKYGGKIIGGDTKESPFLTIAITAIGMVRKNEYMARKGAKAGDAVYVTGSLGKEANLYLGNIDELLNVKPRIKEAHELAKARVATSCMDLSDGLASSLYQLAKINGIGFLIYEKWLPIDDKARKMDSPLEFALYHGGDFELLFTMPEEHEDMLHFNFKKIGYVTEEKILIEKDGKIEEIKNKGYEHFVS